MSTNTASSRSLTFDARRSLKVQIDRATRARMGACPRCNIVHPSHTGCRPALDLTGYPPKRRWTTPEVLHFLELACDVLGSAVPQRIEYDALRGGRRGGDQRMPPSDVAVRRFGSWSAACKAVRTAVTA